MAEELNETFNDTQTTMPSAETDAQRYERLYGTSATQTQQPIVAQLPPEVMQTLSELRNEVVTLKQQTQPRVEQKVEPEINPVGWVEEIKKGNFEGAQRVITQETLKSIRPVFEQELKDVREKAYQQALEATQVQLDIDKHIQTLRSQNPDLVQFERYLQGPVSERVNLAQRAGKIHNPQDFVREYKAAIDAEVGELRNMGLQLRAAGKQDASVRQREVLSATPLQPNQVQLGTPQSQTGGPEAESTDDYFARRRALQYKNHGLQN